MTYRDENEALRARVTKLEEENRELRAKLTPAPPPAPTPQQPDADTSAPSGARVFVRRVLIALGLSAIVFTGLYFGCTPFRGLVWRGDTTFVCPINGEVTIWNKTVRVPDGPAFALDVNCKMRLVRCDVRAKRGLDLSVNNTVVLEDTLVAGTEVAIALGTNSEVEVRGSTITGPITPLDAKIVGLTALPINRVTKDPHAIAPLDYVGRAEEIARLGPGATLRSISALYLDARGLVDLDAAEYKGSVEYEYELPVHEEVAEPPPVRPGLPSAPRRVPARRIVKRVRLDAKGMRPSSGGSDAASPEERVAAPRCSMAQLWTAARRGGVPENAVARVTFDAKGEGSWRFAVEGTEVALDVVNGTCTAPVGAAPVER